jgi:hypothetical protein
MTIMPELCVANKNAEDTVINQNGCRRKEIPHTLWGVKPP